MLKPTTQLQKPPVWGWYVAYCFAMAIQWFLLVLLGLDFIFSGPPNPNMSPHESEVIGLIFIVWGAAFMAPYLAAPFLPRRKWAWGLGFALIILSMSGTCCLPVAIPLLIQWVKPETKGFFDEGSGGRKGF